MVQSVNTKAILTLASIVRRPGLLVPHLSVANVSEVRVGERMVWPYGFFGMRQTHNTLYFLFVLTLDRLGQLYSS